MQNKDQNLNLIIRKKGTPRGRYFAERESFWEGHFWGAPGLNFWFLEGKFKSIKISRKTLDIFCYLNLKCTAKTMKISYFVGNKIT